MAVATYTVTRTNVVGNQRVVDLAAAGDDDYPTGGYPLAASDAGLSEIYHVDAAVAGDYIFAWDSANETIVCYVTDADGGVLVEAADNTDLAAVTIPLVVRGI